MNCIDESIEHLIDAIKDSEEYKTYLELRGKIRQEPEKYKAIHQFRENIYLLQNAKDVDLFDEIDHLWSQYQSLRSQPLVEEYLASELALCRMVQQMNLQIVNHLDFDLGFIQ